MKNVMLYGSVFGLLSLLVSACGPLLPTPTEVTAPVEVIVTSPPIVEMPAPTTASRLPSPSPIAEQLRLEVVQSQTWDDRDGNVRVNVLLRNPYDFPVRPVARSRANLLNAAGEFIRDQTLYYLDGISGGTGFLLPGETVAANGCFTCEKAPLGEEWESVEFLSPVEDATNAWKYSTEVEATIGKVSFSGDNPLFDVIGTVKNNSAAVMNRISARVFVYDQAGKLVGAAEASAWDVWPGATASFSGIGIGEAPEGAVTYEITALGVTY